MEDRERQLEYEGAQRRRVGIISIAAGVCYVLGQLLLIVLVYTKDPQVGLLQGLTPALHGLKEAAVDPRLAQARIVDKNAIENILGWTVTGLGLLLIGWPLRFLRRAESARSGRRSTLAMVFSTYVPPMIGVAGVVLGVVGTIESHRFVTGTNHTTQAYNHIVGAPLIDILTAVYYLGTFLLAVAFIMISLRAMGVGLLTRLIGILGIFAGVVFVIPLVPLPLLQLIWLVSVGLLLLELGGLRLPPAWAAGEAIPWAPRQPAQRGQRQRPQRGAPPRREPAPAALVPSPAPPRPPSPATSKKRKRRRS
jgi:hypothetical protein